MFDVIGKRRYFYILSLIITIPGLIFILLTPFTDAGLQFTIDYTGGTRWEIRFEDPNVTPDQVEAVFAKQGLDAVAVKAGPDFIEIKTEQLTDLQQPEASASPAASLADRERVTGRECRSLCRSQRECRTERQPGCQRIAGPVRLAVRVTRSVGLARRVARPLGVPGGPDRQHQDPDRGQARRGRGRAPGRARTDRGAAQPDHDRRGRQLRPHLAGPDPHRGRVARDHGLDHLPVP